MGKVRRVVIYGAGGHGKVVLDALERGGRDVAGFVDDDPDRAGDAFCGQPVLAAPGEWEAAGGVEFVVAIGDAAGRQRATARLQQLGRELATVVHPAAVIAPDVEVGRGSVILAGATVNPGARVGRGAIINTGAIVDHDCTIGDFAHVAPGARLAGHVSVGARTLVGIGATVVPGVRIGPDAVVGAGAVVLTDVEAGTTVAGVPAKAVARGGVPGARG